MSGVTVIDAGSGKVTAKLGAPSPFNVAMSPTGDRAYVTDLGPGNLTVIDTRAHQVASVVAIGPVGTDPFTARATVATGTSPYGIAVVQAAPTSR